MAQQNLFQCLQKKRVSTEKPEPNPIAASKPTVISTAPPKPATAVYARKRPRCAAQSVRQQLMQRPAGFKQSASQEAIRG